MLHARLGWPVGRAYADLSKALVPCRRCLLNIQSLGCPEHNKLLNERRQSHSTASSRQCQQAPVGQEPPVSAYVHLPFCKRRCYYCDFPVSVVGSKPERSGIQQGMQDYITLLCREIEATVQVPGPPLRTVFFGGGTPTLVPPQLLKQILIALNNKYGIAKGAEISMESDPGTFDMLRLQEYMSLGVNRFSIGVQCFQQELLELCGRSHTLEDVNKAIDDIHQAGVKNWSLDLISGLPQLNSKRWQHSLQEAVSAGPTHISVYDLQVEAKTPFARWYEPGSHPMPTDEATADMYRAASQFLQQSGYEHYEISNYAKPGFRSQHNLGYWRNAPFYAFGVGAASYLFQRRFSRPRSIKAYQQWVTEFANCSSSNGLYAGNVPGIGSMQAEELEEQLLDFVMLRLRLADGIPMDELQRKFGHVAAQMVKATLASGSAYANKYARETCIQGQNHVRLTDPEGFLMSNDCIATLFAELSSGAAYDPTLQTAAL